MPKKIEILIPLFCIFIFHLWSPVCFAKYVIEDTHTVAKIDIDRCKPNIELIDAISSNPYYSNYANQAHLITGHLKVVEKNIVTNHLSPDTLKVAVGNRYAIQEKDYITPEWKSFFLVSENATEKIYEFSFTGSISDGALVLIAPEGIIEDKSRFC